MTVTQKQNLLQYLGYYDGRVDGIWGTLSAAAEADFRAHNGSPKLGDELEEVLIGAVFHGKTKDTAEAVPEVSGAENFWSSVKYFKREEFACKCGRCGGYPVEPAESLVRALDKIRERTGLPVYINSGVRCRAHNAAEGGATDSRHLYGDAADIRCPGKTAQQLYSIGCDVIGNSGGVGRYEWGTHVDTRGYNARWTG